MTPHFSAFTLEDGDAVEPLMRMLERVAEETREHAVKALQEIGAGAKKAIPVLEKLLREHDPRVDPSYPKLLLKAIERIRATAGKSAVCSPGRLL